jgi:F-type H+-transporting ATPase subunit delta
VSREITAARRYAEVLLELAQEASRVREIRGELSALAEMVKAEASLREALANPRVSQEEKRRVLRQLVPEASDLLFRFLDVVLKKGRLGELPEIAAVYEELADALAGILPAVVETVVPLTDEERAEVARRLQERTGKEVLVTERLNPTLIGGARVLIGGEVLDMSIASRLARLKERLIMAEAVGNGGS